MTPHIHQPIRSTDSFLSTSVTRWLCWVGVVATLCALAPQGALAPQALVAQEDEPKPYPLKERYRPTAMPDRIILTWSQDPTTSQTVTWRTDDTVTESIAHIAIADSGPANSAEHKKVAAVTTSFQSDASLAHYHRVTFEDLTPSTKYMYRVGDGVNFSEWNHFTTAADSAEPFSFIYFGDAQNDIRSSWSRVVRQAYTDAPHASFLLHAGDLVNNSAADVEWGQWFESAGWIHRTTPSIATPGNHEYRTYDEDGEARRGVTLHWNPTFSFPQNGPDPLKNTTYFLDYQGVRIVSLDSNKEHALQAEWLDKVLTESEQSWTVVTMHHPIYSATPERDNAKLREALQPVFDKHRVDIVLQGHDHAYSRSDLMQFSDNEPTGRTARSGKGTLYVVSVSGPKMYDLGYRDFTKRGAEDTQLFQIITVDGDRMKYEARTAAGLLYDAFELVKREGESNELIDLIPETPERLRVETAK